jgi:hypothetical protein
MNAESQRHMQHTCAMQMPDVPQDTYRQDGLPADRYAAYLLPEALGLSPRRKRRRTLHRISQGKAQQEKGISIKPARDVAL